MKKILNKFALFALAVVSLCGCSTEDATKHHFDNKLFMNVNNPVEKLVFDNVDEVITQEREITLGTALEAEQRITAKIVKNTALVEEYNKNYNTKAEVLPEDMCVIEKPDAIIEPGEIASNPVKVTFTNLQTLNRDLIYVMPIVVSEVSGIGTLDSKLTQYFIFKGASLINVVANIAKNYFEVEFKNPSVASNLDAVTVEALVYVDDFTPDDGSKADVISTLFGTENEFLLRFGDVGFPENQLQMVCPGGKFPEGNSALGIPTGEWVHVAAVWDGANRERIIYTNGKEVARDNKAAGKVTVAWDGCCIGRSFNDERWFNGSIAELRVWSVQRTPEELAANIYKVDPNSEHLIAYWKFNEGTGKVVKDYSKYGSDIKAVNDILWQNVELPEEKK